MHRHCSLLLGLQHPLPAVRVHALQRLHEVLQVRNSASASASAVDKSTNSDDSDDSDAAADDDGDATAAAPREQLPSADFLSACLHQCLLDTDNLEVVAHTLALGPALAEFVPADVVTSVLFAHVLPACRARPLAPDGTGKAARRRVMRAVGAYLAGPLACGARPTLARQVLPYVVATQRPTPTLALVQSLAADGASAEADGSTDVNLCHVAQELLELVAWKELSKKCSAQAAASANQALCQQIASAVVAAGGVDVDTPADCSIVGGDVFPSAATTRVNLARACVTLAILGETLRRTTGSARVAVSHRILDVAGAALHRMDLAVLNGALAFACDRAVFHEECWRPDGGDTRTDTPPNVDMYTALHTVVGQCLAAPHQPASERDAAEEVRQVVKSVLWVILYAPTPLATSDQRRKGKSKPSAEEMAHRRGVRTRLYALLLTLPLAYAVELHQLFLARWVGSGTTLAFLTQTYLSTTSPLETTNILCICLSYVSAWQHASTASSAAPPPDAAETMGPAAWEDVCSLLPVLLVAYVAPPCNAIAREIVTVLQSCMSGWERGKGCASQHEHAEMCAMLLALKTNEAALASDASYLRRLLPKVIVPTSTSKHASVVLRLLTQIIFDAARHDAYRLSLNESLGMVSSEDKFAIYWPHAAVLTGAASLTTVQRALCTTAMACLEATPRVLEWTGTTGSPGILDAVLGVVSDARCNPHVRETVVRGLGKDRVLTGLPRAVTDRVFTAAYTVYTRDLCRPREVPEPAAAAPGSTEEEDDVDTSTGDAGNSQALFDAVTSVLYAVHVDAEMLVDVLKTALVHATQEASRKAKRTKHTSGAHRATSEDEAATSVEAISATEPMLELLQLKDIATIDNAHALVDPLFELLSLALPHPAEAHPSIERTYGCSDGC